MNALSSCRPSSSSASRCPCEPGPDARPVRPYGDEADMEPVTHLCLGPGGWWRYAWRQLKSMRTALLLLVTIAATPGGTLLSA